VPTGRDPQAELEAERLAEIHLDEAEALGDEEASHKAQEELSATSRGVVTQP
jgi:hypothetical protein